MKNAETVAGVHTHTHTHTILKNEKNNNLENKGGKLAFYLAYTKQTIGKCNKNQK